MKGAEIVSEFLERTATNIVFGVSGANCEDLFDCIHQKGKTKIILSKSEYGAAAMAMGYYLAHKKTGVVITTSGPGILNTIPILAEAFTSRIPILILAGSVSENQEGQGAFQDTSGKNGSLDLSQMLKACTGYHVKISDTDENLIEILFKAVEFSARQCSPVVVEIPKNISQKDFLSALSYINDDRKIELDQETLNRAVYFCETSVAENNRPLIVLGDEGVHLSSSEGPAAIASLAENLDCDVVCTPNAKGIVNNFSPRFKGLLGIMGHESARTAFKNATHVIYFGFKPDKLGTIGIESELSLKENFHLNFPKGEEILKKLNSFRFIEKKKSSFVSQSLNEKSNSVFNIENILAEIQKKQSNKDCNVFVDAGNTGAYVVHHYQCSGKGLFSISLGMGGMGNSIGAAIGAASTKSVRSLVFCGDGSFLIQGMEIHTALQYNLPVTFFILNNNAHGMCATRENLFLNGETGINKFKSSFFASGILKMFPGIPAREIYSMNELEECLHDFKNARGPVVLSINISNTDNPPFLTFKRSLT